MVEIVDIVCFYISAKKSSMYRVYNPCNAEFILAKIKQYFHFLLFVNLVPWLLMTWWQKEPVHQQQWYWPSYLEIFWFQHHKGSNHDSPDSKVRGANMAPTWVLSAPDVPHVCPMNLAIKECNKHTESVVCDVSTAYLIVKLAVITLKHFSQLPTLAQISIVCCIFCQVIRLNANQ